MNQDSTPVKTPGERSQPITIASILFLLVGLGMSIADPILLSCIAYFRTAPILPLIGDVLDDNTPIGMVGGLNARMCIMKELIVVQDWLKPR